MSDIILQEHNPLSGITTRVHDVDGRVTIEKQYDAQPFVDVAAEMRAQTAGESWGELRHVGFIPMAELATMMRRDGTIDKKACLEFIRRNPKLATFDKVLKK